MKWDKYQRAVFEDVAHGTGHTVVQAVAGSGKTSTIMEALKYVPNGCTALLLAFNKKVAVELSRRAPRGVAVATLHGHGLQAAGWQLGVSVDEKEQRVDRLYERTFGKKKYKEDVELVRVLKKALRLAKGALAKTEEEVRAVIEEFGVGEVLDADESDLLVRRTVEFLTICAELSDRMIDFADMIWLPIVKDLKLRRYDRVFVDETQDLDRAQIELVLRSVAPGGRVLAVGDPRQAIYRFRGADSHALPNVIARLGAKVLPLSVCYRCGSKIIQKAQKWVPEIEAAPGAAAGSVQAVSKDTMLKGAAPGDFILSRTNAPLIGLCLRFISEGVPANIEGRDIGRGLTASVRKSMAETVEELRDRIELWGAAERARLVRSGRDPRTVDDRLACLLTLSDGAQSVEDVFERIDELFANVKDDTNRIVLATTHKAKGLERNRVWLLEGTYLRYPGVEEENLYYVGITRARRELMLVDGFEPKREDRGSEREEYNE